MMMNLVGVLIILNFILFLFPFFFYYRYARAFLRRKISSTETENVYTLSKKVVPVIVPIRNEPRKLLSQLIAHWILNFNDNMFLMLIVDDSDDRELKSYLEFFSRLKSARILEKDRKKLVIQFGNIFFIHRYYQKGKGSAINFGINYLIDRLNLDFDYFAVYDIEWLPTKLNILKGINFLEKNTNYAFVQFNRRSKNKGILSIFSSIFFDFVMVSREVLGEPIMFTGSCGVIRLKSFLELGGFKNHIVEDAEFSLRCYLHGLKGKYLYELKEYGENLPDNFNSAINTFFRWVYGAMLVLKENFVNIIKSERLSLKDKISFFYMYSCGTCYVFSVLMILINFYLMFVSPQVSLIEYFILTFFPFWHILTVLFIFCKIVKEIGYNINPLSLFILGWSIDVMLFLALFKVLIGIREVRRVTVKVGSVSIKLSILISYITILVLTLLGFLYFVSLGEFIGILIYGFWTFACLFFLLHTLKWIKNASENEL